MRLETKLLLLCNNCYKRDCGDESGDYEYVDDKEGKYGDDNDGGNKDARDKGGGDKGDSDGGEK